MVETKIINDLSNVQVQYKSNNNNNTTKLISFNNNFKLKKNEIILNVENSFINNTIATSISAGASNATALSKISIPLSNTANCLNKLSNNELPNASKRSNDLLSIYSSTSIENLNENLWDAFQEHYEYLMDKGLIETCQLSGIQANQNENVSGTVSFTEFLHQFNELTKWINQMQSMRFDSSLDSFCEKYANQIFYEEIIQRSPRRKLLTEYARHLVKYHPHLKNDVLIKLHYLNKQWKSMEFSFFYKRYYDSNIIKDLQADLEKFENWLNEKEIYLDNLVVDRKWNLEDIEENLRVHKSLQTDIESHARIINSVLKLSEKIKQISIDYSHFYDSGISLQERWHCLWLKSLEWQCRLEQKKKAINKNSSFELKLNLNNSLLSTSSASSTSTSPASSSTSSTSTSSSSSATNTSVASISSYEDTLNSNNNNNNRIREDTHDKSNSKSTYISNNNNQQTLHELNNNIIQTNDSSSSKTNQIKEDFYKTELNLVISPIYEEEEGFNYNQNYIERNCYFQDFDKDSIEEEEVITDEDFVEEEEEEYEYEEDYDVNDDIIPFHEHEYEKIVNTPTPSKSLTPSTSNNSLNCNNEEMNKLLINMNQYYSLTDIKAYNIDDDSNLVNANRMSDDENNKLLIAQQHEYYNDSDEYQLNNIEQENREEEVLEVAAEEAEEDEYQDEQQQLDVKHDIGYSSDQEGIESPDTKQNKQASENEQHNKSFFKRINQYKFKSFSDYYVDKKLKEEQKEQQELEDDDLCAKFSKYRRYFSRYSRTSKYFLNTGYSNNNVNSQTKTKSRSYVNSDDDYVADEDEEFDETEYDCEYYNHDTSNEYNYTSDCEQNIKKDEQQQQSLTTLVSSNSIKSSTYNSNNKLQRSKNKLFSKYNNSNGNQNDNNTSIYCKQSSTTSAYDTSSNLSNEGYHYYHHYHHHHHHHDHLNTSLYSNHNKEILSIETNSNESKPIIRLYEESNKQNVLCDETSTTSNTDMSTDIAMSDPHWDGYTSSSYYNNLNIENDIKLNPPQPILPWDGIFFELEPNETYSNKSHNSNQVSKKFKQILNNISNSKRQSLNNQNILIYNYYNSNSNNNNNNIKNNLNKDKSKSISTSSSSTVSSTNSLSSSSSTSSYNKKSNKYNHHHHHHNHRTHSNSNRHLYHSESDDSEMEELTNIINDSIEQWNQACNTLHDNLAMNNLHIYNEILATCQTNITCLLSIKNSIDKCVKVKSKEYSKKLDEIITKWRTLEPNLIAKKANFTNFLTMINEIKTIHNSLSYINNLCKERNFKSITCLRAKIEELERKNINLSEYLTKINELKATLNELSQNGMDVQNLCNHLNVIKNLHSDISSNCKLSIERLQRVLCDWILLEDLFNEIRAIFDTIKATYQLNKGIDTTDFEYNFNLKLSSNKLISCEKQLNKIKTFCNITLYEMDLLKLDKLKLEYNTLSQLINENNYLNKEKLLKSVENTHKNVINETNNFNLNIIRDNNNNNNNHNNKSSQIINNTNNNNGHNLDSSDSIKKQNIRNEIKKQNTIELNMQLDELNEEFISTNEIGNFQMTSTPRYKQDTIKNQNLQFIEQQKYQALQQQHQQIKNQKLYFVETSDKSTATYDENSTQTDTVEIEKNKIFEVKTNKSKTASVQPILVSVASKVVDDNNVKIKNRIQIREEFETSVEDKNNSIKKPEQKRTYRSVDSGIGAFDHTTSEVQSYSGPSSLSHSFVKTESFDINEDENEQEEDEIDEENQEEENGEEVEECAAVVVDDNNQNNLELDNNNIDELLNGESNKNASIIRKRLINDDNQIDNNYENNDNLLINDLLDNNNLEIQSSGKIRIRSINSNNKKEEKRSFYKKIFLYLFYFLLICFITSILVYVIFHPSCNNFKKQYFYKYIFADVENFRNEPTPF